VDEPRYKLIFTGQIQDGHRIEDVMKYTGESFRLPPSILHHLFSGGEQVVKKRGTREVCEKIKAVFDKAGAVARIEQEPSLRLEPRLNHPYFHRGHYGAGAGASSSVI
jgi:hypothetical protein